MKIIFLYFFRVIYSILYYLHNIIKGFYIIKALDYNALLKLNIL